VGTRRPLALAAACLAAACSFGPVAASAQAASSDRTIKWCLAERLPSAPGLVVLGSSRAMKVEPDYLQARTGLSAFNAAVSAGGPPDAWAFANFLHDRFPGARERVLWLLDVAAFRAKPPDSGLAGTPDLAQYLGGPPSAAARAATARPTACTFRTSAGTRYSARGLRVHDFHDAALARGATLADGLRVSIADYSRIYSRYPALSPTAEDWFARTVAALDSWGSPPVVVLTPLQPTLERTLGPLGWSARHAEVTAYLHALQAHARLTVLDASDVSAFGGDPAAFYDGVHMTAPNVRTLLDWVLARTGPALSR
jgi:hypothetical protein